MRNYLSKFFATCAAVVVCAAASVANAGYADLVLSDPGLVSYWRFEGEITDGGTLLDEYTAERDNGPNNGFYPDDGGVTATEGILGQGAEFDGEPFQVVEIDNEENFDFTENMTVEAWFLTDGFDKNWQAIVNKGDDQWRLHRRSGECGLAFGRDENGTTNRDTLDSGVCVDDGEWHQAVAVFDIDAPAALYLDGELIMSGDNDGEDSEPLGELNTDVGDNVDLPVMIGGNAQDGAHWRAWTGLIDEVSIYNRSLSAEEVKEHYDAMFGGLPHDYNENEVYDAEDLDLHRGLVASGDAAGDVNGDGTTDAADRVAWIKTLQESWVGDANFDGEFNSADFVFVFTAGKYETGQEAGYAEGDWDGDALFSSADFVAAFTDGGYEQGPLPEVAAVPEPSSIALLLLGALALIGKSRRS